jgi:dihydropteroate synthase
VIPIEERFPRPSVMGVVNVTPDSFSDGGRFLDSQRAIDHALAMVAAGAGILDVGGESTRPGARAVSEADEIRRVVPVIEALAARVAVPISIDTSKPGVIVAAVKAGATMVNDVRALRDEGALRAVAASSAAVCLMHMQGEFLLSRIDACLAGGIPHDRLVIDPGIGFGKRATHNLDLLAALPKLRALGVPLLIGVSRKSLFGELLGRPVDERLAGGIAVATAAVLAGANIVRTHDVAETVDAVRVASALQSAGYGSSTRIAGEQT